MLQLSSGWKCSHPACCSILDLKYLFHIWMFTYISYVVLGSRDMPRCSLTCLFRAHSKISTYCSEYDKRYMIRDVHLHVCSGDIPRFSLLVLCSGHQMYDVLLFRKGGGKHVSRCSFIIHLFQVLNVYIHVCSGIYSKVFTCSSLFRTPDVWRISVQEGGGKHMSRCCSFIHLFQVLNVYIHVCSGIYSKVFTCSSLFRTPDVWRISVQEGGGKHVSRCCSFIHLFQVLNVYLHVCSGVRIHIIGGQKSVRIAPPSLPPFSRALRHFNRSFASC